MLLYVFFCGCSDCACAGELVGQGRGGYVVMWELGYLWGVCDLRDSLGIVEIFCVGVLMVYVCFCGESVCACVGEWLGMEEGMW